MKRWCISCLAIVVCTLFLPSIVSAQVFQMSNGQVVVLGSDDISEQVVIERRNTGNNPRTFVLVYSMRPDGFVNPMGSGFFTNVTDIFVHIGSGEANKANGLGMRDSASIPGDLEVICPDQELSLGIVDAEIGGDVLIDTSSGDDRITIRDSTIGGDVHINSNRGIDDFVFEDTSFGGDVKINSGNGHDVIRFEAVDIADKLDVRTENGNDTFDLVVCNVGGSSNINMGRHRDKVCLFASSLGTTLINGGSGSIDFGDQDFCSFGRGSLFFGFELGNMAN